MPTDLLPQLKPAQDQGQVVKILIIDDEQDQVQALSLRLRRQGYETISANCGRDGLKTALEARPQLVLLDVGLPDISGLSVCEQLVDAVETCGIPVVIVSAADSPDIVRRCRAAGSQYFIRKPYDPNVLLTLIERALENSW